MSTFASTVCGYISIVCWIVVFTPQLYENYARKSGDGLSMTFLVIWLAGDIFNLIGVIMQDLLSTMFILALWYTVADIGLVWQVIHYRREWMLEYSCEEQEPINTHQTSYTSSSTESIKPNEPIVVTAKHSANRNHTINYIGGGSILLITLISCYAYSQSDTLPRNTLLWSTLSQIMGWGSAILYVGSRIPQIIKNWRNKSTEGLSFGMFICAVLGNIFFTSSIFLRSLEPHYLMVNMAWIIGSCGTLVFDFIIFLQFFVYDRPKVVLHVE
ncbi:PQ loop repeat-domain-containing protein [Spinellus fusiger]|nr:PQ loop repeat-domain-containing protein [Spinellus fusiger]